MMWIDTRIFISIFFGLTVITAILWFYFSSRSKIFLLLITSWATLQSFLALSGIYLDSKSMPPKIFLFGIAPPIILMLLLFFTKAGRTFIGSLDLKILTYFHLIRIPVEIVLLMLFQHGLVSVYMTFEGTNFDILSGLTAPFAAYFCFRHNSIKLKLLLIWNIICLLLLFNVVITAALAVPSPFQLLSFDQPNIAVLYFPFNLLPALVVPLVLFAHFAVIFRLTKREIA